MYFTVGTTRQLLLPRRLPAKLRRFHADGHAPERGHVPFRLVLFDLRRLPVLPALHAENIGFDCSAVDAPDERGVPHAGEGGEGDEGEGGEAHEGKRECFHGRRGEEVTNSIYEWHYDTRGSSSAPSEGDKGKKY